MAASKSPGGGRVNTGVGAGKKKGARKGGDKQTRGCIRTNEEEDTKGVKSKEPKDAAKDAELRKMALDKTPPNAKKHKQGKHGKEDLKKAAKGLKVKEDRDMVKNGFEAAFGG